MPKKDDQSEKMKILDDIFLQTEQLKDLIISETRKLNSVMEESVKTVASSDPKVLNNTINSLKSFLQSSSSMMSSLNQQVKEITSDVSKLKVMMDQVGKSFQ